MRAEKFQAVKLDEILLFLVRGGTKDTTWHTEVEATGEHTGESGTDNIADDRKSTTYYNGTTGEHIPEKDRTNDQRLW